MCLLFLFSERCFCPQHQLRLFSSPTVTGKHKCAISENEPCVEGTASPLQLLVTHNLVQKQ